LIYGPATRDTRPYPNFLTTKNIYERDGWSMLTLLPSVSINATYNPTPGISHGSPSTLPPASSTFFICSFISSTAITTEGYCAGLSSDLGKKPPLMAPGFLGRPFLPTSVVVAITSVSSNQTRLNRNLPCVFYPLLASRSEQLDSFSYVYLPWYPSFSSHGLKPLKLSLWKNNPFLTIVKERTPAIAKILTSLQVSLGCVPICHFFLVLVGYIQHAWG
jgi:hypothetical protein